MFAVLLATGLASSILENQDRIESILQSILDLTHEENRYARTEMEGDLPEEEVEEHAAILDDDFGSDMLNVTEEEARYTRSLLYAADFDEEREARSTGIPSGWQVASPAFRCAPAVQGNNWRNNKCTAWACCMASGRGSNWCRDIRSGFCTGGCHIYKCSTRCPDGYYCTGGNKCQKKTDKSCIEPCPASGCTNSGYMFFVTRNAAISGHNREQHGGSVAQCQALCQARSWCKSFDYYKHANKCDLSDKNAADVGGLKTNYNGNPYDHYEKTADIELKPGATCSNGFKPMTSSWQDCRDAAISLGYTGDSVAHVDYNYNWGASRPQGCFQSNGNNRFHFNRGAGGSFQGTDKILCMRSYGGGCTYVRRQNKEPNTVLWYTGSAYGCSTAHGQCFWPSEAEAKRGCSSWDKCEALYCTARHNSGRYVCYARTGKATRYESGDTMGYEKVCSGASQPVLKQLDSAGWSACSSSRKCPACKGDCDSDNDCQSGLKCRHDPKTPPAGCTGSLRSYYDYCA